MTPLAGQHKGDVEHDERIDELAEHGATSRPQPQMRIAGEHFQTMENKKVKKLADAEGDQRTDDDALRGAENDVEVFIADGGKRSGARFAHEVERDEDIRNQKNRQQRDTAHPGNAVVFVDDVGHDEDNRPDQNPDREVRGRFGKPQEWRDFKRENFTTHKFGQNGVSDKKPRQDEVEAFFAMHHSVSAYFMNLTHASKKKPCAMEQTVPDKKAQRKLLIGRLIHLSIIMAVATVLGVFALKIILSHYKLDHKPMELGADARGFATKSRNGTYMKLSNLHFRLTDEINMQVKELVGEAIPKTKNGIVNFDDVNSFRIDILSGEAFVRIGVMEHIFNNYVFNYDGSPLKNMKMEFIDDEDNGKPIKKLRLTGDMKLVLWIGFEMVGKMYLDREKTLMVIEAERIKSLGNPYTKTLLDTVGLNMEKLLPVPSGRGITMNGNKIIVEPFKIFPPPQIGGFISDMRIQSDGLQLFFSSKTKVNFPPLPVKDVKNYLYLYQGDVKFGKLMMVDARLQMVDQSQKNDFDFYLKKYQIPLGYGYSKIMGDGSVVAYIPDYRDVAK